MVQFALTIATLLAVSAASQIESQSGIDRIREGVSADYDKLLNQGYWACVRVTVDRNDNEFIFSKYTAEGLYDVNRKGDKIIHRFSKKPNIGCADLDRQSWIVAFDGKNSWGWDKPNVEHVMLHRPKTDESDVDWINYGLPAYEPFSEAIGLPSHLQREALFSARGAVTQPFRLDIALATGQYKVVADGITIGDSKCVVVEREGLDKIWLDPTKNWAVIRRDWNWGEGLSIRARIWNEDFKRQSGVWVPKSFRIEYFSETQTVDKKALDSDVPATVVHGVVEDFKIGVPSDFTPSAPPGTPIMDNTGKEPRRVYMPQTPGITLAQFKAADWSSSQFRTNPASTRPWKIPVLITSNLLIVIVLVLFAANRRWRQKGRETK